MTTTYTRRDLDREAKLAARDDLRRRKAAGEASGRPVRISWELRIAPNDHVSLVVFYLAKTPQTINGVPHRLPYTLSTSVAL